MIRLFHWGTALLFLITATNAFAVVTPPPRGARAPAQDVSTPLGRDQLATALDNTEKTRDALIKLPDSGFSNIGDLVTASKSASEILPDGLLGPTTGNAGTDRGFASAGGARGGGTASGGGGGDQPRTMERSDEASLPDVGAPSITSAPPSGNTGGGDGNSLTDRIIGAGDAPPQTFNASIDGAFGSVQDSPPGALQQFKGEFGTTFGDYGDYTSYLPPPDIDKAVLEASNTFSQDNGAFAKGSNAPFTLPIDPSKTNLGMPIRTAALNSDGTKTDLGAIFQTGITATPTPSAGTTGTAVDDKSKAIADKIAKIDPPKTPGKEPVKEASVTPAGGENKKDGKPADTSISTLKVVSNKNSATTPKNKTPAKSECIAACNGLSARGLSCAEDEYNTYKRFSVSYDGDMYGDDNIKKFETLESACGTDSPGFKVKQGGAGIEILFNSAQMSDSENVGYKKCLDFVKKNPDHCLASAAESSASSSPAVNSPPAPPKPHNNI